MTKKYKVGDLVRIKDSVTFCFQGYWGKLPSSQIIRLQKGVSPGFSSWGAYVISDEMIDYKLNRMMVSMEQRFERIEQMRDETHEAMNILEVAIREQNDPLPPWESFYFTDNLAW